MVYAVGLCVLFLLFKWLGFSPRSTDQNGKRLPGPPAKFMFGNLKALKEAKEKGQFSLGLWEVCKKCEGAQEAGCMALQLPFFAGTLVVVHSPQALRDLLGASHKVFPKNSKYEAMEYALGRGLITENGSKWALHRRIIEQAFRANILQSMLPQFAKHAEEIGKIWTSKLASLSDTRNSTAPSVRAEAAVEVDIRRHMSAVTLDIIAEVAFGHLLDSKSTLLQDADEAKSLAAKGGYELNVTGAVTEVLREMRQRFDDITPFPRFEPTRWLRGQVRTFSFLFQVCCYDCLIFWLYMCLESLTLSQRSG
jgi:hypothetical protein